jgi:hypothetical protein
VQSYSAYGLTIASPFALPELPPAPSSSVPDVTIREGDVVAPPLLRARGHGVVWEQQATLLFARGVGTFRVTHGCDVMVCAAPDANAVAVRLFLAGPVLAMVLHQRGELVLHGSVVALHGSGVGFLGHSGSGKSTLAAALHVAGHPLQSDDVCVPVPAQGGEYQVAAGYPALKLWGSAVHALPHVGAGTAFSQDRGLYPVAGGTAAVPLRGLYVLDYGADLERERVRGAPAVAELLRHSYWVAELGPAARARLLEQCATLAREVPLFRLQRPRGFDHLEDTVCYVASVA